jgi:cytochrome c oxidase subunit 3
MNALTSPAHNHKVMTARIALLTALGTESVFFLTLIVAYIALRNQFNWPMEHTLSRLAFPLANSAVLILSALTAWRAQASISLGDQTGLKSWLLVTLLLGLFFVAGQVFDFTNAGLRINDQAFGGVFFTLMGFHALHVLAGVVILTMNSLRARLGDFTAEKHIAIEIGTYFWYYVTAVWIILFAALFLV